MVAGVPDKGEPLHVLHDGVEFVSVDDENAPPVRRAMDGMLLDRDVSVGAIKRTDHLIVISGNVDDACSLARFAQNFLHDVIVLLRPINAAAHLPDVDQVAHDVEHFEIVLAQEIE